MKRFKIDGHDKAAVDRFLVDNEREVWHLILEAVEDCIENDLDEKQVFELDPEVDKLFVFRSSFKTTLEKALPIFESYEDYEQCARCQKILGELEY
jgi:hypothetical protein